MDAWTPLIGGSSQEVSRNVRDVASAHFQQALALQMALGK
jgi:hypothetical protein